MKNIFILGLVLIGFASCTKYVEVPIEEPRDGGMAYASYDIKKPVEIISPETIPGGQSSEFRSMYGQKPNGNIGAKRIYLLHFNVRLNSIQAAEEIRKKGYEPAGPGYLFALINEYKSLLPKYSDIQCVLPGGLTYTDRWDNKQYKVAKIEAYVYASSYMLYSPEYDRDDEDIFFICYKK